MFRKYGTMNKVTDLKLEKSGLSPCIYDAHRVILWSAINSHSNLSIIIIDKDRMGIISRRDNNVQIITIYLEFMNDFYHTELRDYSQICIAEIIQYI